MNSPMNPPMNNEKRLVVFTDLDGCLFKEARWRLTDEHRFS